MYQGIKGLYLITRKSHSKQNVNSEPIYYIGQAKDIFERFNAHCTSQTGQYIDTEINKNGIEKFSFEILQIINKQIDRDKAEKKAITEYIAKYGEKSLYNNQTGGKKGHNIINKERQKLSKELRKIIKEIFNKDISYSIDLIAEHYKLHWKEVVNIRKPMLAKQGLKYDNKTKFVVEIKSGIPPEIWHGGTLTNKQVELYCNHKNKEIDEIANLMKVSITDLKIFKNEYDGKEKDYKTAEMCCDTDLLIDKI